MLSVNCTGNVTRLRSSAFGHTEGDNVPDGIDMNGGDERER